MQNIGIFSNKPVNGLAFILGKQKPHYRNPDYWDGSQAEAFDIVYLDMKAAKVGEIVNYYQGFEIEVVDLAEVDKVVEPETNAQPEMPFPQEASPSAHGQEQNVPAFSEMNVREMRAFAQEQGIPIPSHVNTRDEITAHLAEQLANKTQD